ncbi:hypothetical protein BST61_g2410 [Cercospora zeina]
MTLPDTSHPETNQQQSAGPASSESPFTFFNISHPSEARSSQYRTKSFRPFQPDAKTGPENKRQRVAIEHIDPASATCYSRPKHEKRRKISLNAVHETAIGHHDSETSEATVPEQPPSTQDMVHQQRVPTPDSLSVARHDPFNSYSTPWQPWYDGLLHYMMTIFAPRAWPTLKITSAEGMKWETFMTQHAMQEPALFYVRLLFASGELVQSGSLRRERSHWLQAQAIKVINEALSHPARSISDGLILAVGRIALHECMYGNRDAANHIHRPAQRRMIDLRGGMKELHFPPLVKRLMRWSDRVMSMYGNTERMLPDADDSDGGTYGMTQSLNAFEVWAPEPGKALRRRIAIDGLIN